jgi:biopolymer transport protein ExbD
VSKKHSMPEMKEGGVNVTPLIDVVMCLIIFFMLVAKIGVNKGGPKMDLPETIIGVKLEKLLGTLILNVTDPNIVGYDAKGKAIRTGGNKPLDPIITAIIDKEGTAKEVRLMVKDSKGDIVDEPLTRVLAAMQKKNKDFSVTVRAQKQLQFKDLQRVILAIAKAKVSKVNYGGAAKKV